MEPFQFQLLQFKTECFLPYKAGGFLVNEKIFCHIINNLYFCIVVWAQNVADGETYK